jgi:hypothetical protein
LEFETMAQSPADERLLAILEPEPDAQLPEGYKLAKLREAGIFGPMVSHKYATRGKKRIDLNATENARKIAEWDRQRITIIDRDSPFALDAWLLEAERVQAYQRSIEPHKLNDTAERDSDAAITSRTVAIRR